MIIPFISRDSGRCGAVCRDGEIDFVVTLGDGSEATAAGDSMAALAAAGASPVVTLRSAGAAESSAIHTIRLPLDGGERPKAELMLGGEISRVDAATAERLTGEMVRKAAEVLVELSADLRRQGLFILPFRYHTMVMTPEGVLSYPSAQGVALPTDRPPHPEITAASVTDDSLTLALRFPVTPHRLEVKSPAGLPHGARLRTFISYPLYIPDPKEMRGSIGSVRSASGGQALGIRFGFLSASALKASVAAPEKYHELVGNERTGYRFSSKATGGPDYTCYAEVYGKVPPFPKASLLAVGEGVDADTDPFDWIADWEEAGGGCLPLALPWKYRQDGTAGATEGVVWPEGIDRAFVLSEAERLGGAVVLLTRPMMFGSDSVSRRHAEGTGIRTLRVLGLPASQAGVAILYGSDDCVRWSALRRFDPRVRACVLTPRRLFWRLLVVSSREPVAVEVVTNCG